MIKKILAVLTAIGGAFSAIFYVFFKQAKTERKLIEEQYQKNAARSREEQTEAMRKAENAVHKSIAKQEAEDEELVKRSGAGNDLNSFNAGIDLLRKQSERGNKRNTGTSSTRA